jgi:hypothetical protein
MFERDRGGLAGVGRQGCSAEEGFGSDAAQRGEGSCQLHRQVDTTGDALSSHRRGIEHA